MILFYEDGRPEVNIPITLLVVLHREKSRRRREISSRNFLSVTVEDHEIIMAKMVYSNVCTSKEYWTSDT